MGNHIFLASQKNFDISLRYGVYGGIRHSFERTNAEIVASFAGIKPGDFIFFYVKNIGIYGLWKATTRPFYDDTNLFGDPDQTYPYRICFEPTIRQFLKPISLSDILDLRDKGRIWTFDLGTFNKKSHHPVTTDEGKELIRLLLRNNPIFYEVSPISAPYTEKAQDVPIKLETDKRGEINYEGYLNAWFMKSFSQDKFKDLIGGYKDFLNYVPTSFNTVMDIFLTHVTSIDSVDILHNYTCMELKTGVCIERNLNQIIKYENWLIRKLASGDSEMVQSILVAFDFDESILKYVQQRKEIEEKTVRLFKYKVNETKTDIVLSEVKL